MPQQRPIEDHESEQWKTVSMEDCELHALLEAHHQDCFGWALHCCGHDWERARDVMQIAYLKILQGKAVYQGRSSFKTWMYSLVRNCSAEERRRDYWRSLGLLRFQEKGHSEPPPDTPEECLQKNQHQKICLETLSLLSAKQREVLHLVFYQEMTVEEAASVMGVSIGSARTHYDRAKKQLRKLLKRGEA